MITNIDAIIVNLTTIVLLPVLVMQARYLLYRFQHQGYDSPKDLIVFIEERFSYDFAIIDLTLGFVSIAAIQVIATPPANTQSILLSFVMALFSFFLMSMIAIVKSGKFVYSWALLLI